MAAMKAHQSNPMLSAQDNAMSLAQGVQGALGKMQPLIMAKPV